MKKLFITFIAIVLALFTVSCSVQNIYFEGTVKVKNSTNIVIDFPAAVTAVKVKDGDKVKKGDVLVSLDFSEYLNQIKTKENLLDISKLELQNLLSTTNSDQDSLKGINNEMKKILNSLNSKKKALEDNNAPDIMKSLNDLKYSEEVYSTTLNELSTKNDLFNYGAITKNELDGFKKTADDLKKSVEDKKFALDILKKSKQNEIDTLRSTYEEKLLQLENQKNLDNNKSDETDISINIQKKKIELEETEIKGMKDKLNKEYLKQKDIISVADNCVVSDIGYSKGDLISSNQKVISLLNLDSIYIEANVPLDLVEYIEVGKNVKIVPYANNTRSYTGKVISISGKAIKDSEETIIPAVISIDNKDDFLRANFDVDIYIDGAN